MPVSDTRWYTITKEIGGTLCVNNSCSASRVTDTKPGLPSGVERAAHLKNKIYSPDIIVVYMGTNDLGGGVSVALFKKSYSRMLEVIKENYPESDVYCCTLLPEGRNIDKPDILLEYNQATKDAAALLNFKVIDFYSDISDWDNLCDTFDDGTLRVHPNVSGMKKMAEAATKAIQAH